MRSIGSLDYEHECDDEYKHVGTYRDCTPPSGNDDQWRNVFTEPIMDLVGEMSMETLGSTTRQPIRAAHIQLPRAQPEHLLACEVW